MAEMYRSGNDKCKIFEKKQLIFPIDLSKILHLGLPTRYFSKCLVVTVKSNFIVV